MPLFLVDELTCYFWSKEAESPYMPLQLFPPTHQGVMAPYWIWWRCTTLRGASPENYHTSREINSNVLNSWDFRVQLFIFLDYHKAYHSDHQPSPPGHPQCRYCHGERLLLPWFPLYLPHLFWARCPTTLLSSREWLVQLSWVRVTFPSFSWINNYYFWKEDCSSFLRKKWMKRKSISLCNIKIPSPFLM